MFQKDGTVGYATAAKVSSIKVITLKFEKNFLTFL